MIDLFSKIIVAFFVVVFALLSSSGFIVIFGLKPNLFLSFMFFSLFLGFSTLTIIFFLSLSLPFLLWQPILSPPLISLSLLIVIFAVARRYLNFSRPLNTASALFIATFIFYAVSNFSFLISFPLLVFLEAVLNVLILIILIWLNGYFNKLSLL